jgi:hypothetical protein
MCRLALLFEFVVVPVEYPGHRSHLFGEQPQVEFHIATLGHASQVARRVDFPRGSVNCRPVTPNVARMASRALVIGNQLFTQLEISILKNAGDLGCGQTASQSPTHRDCI